MADNYLERKMDEYRSGKRAGAPRRLTPTGQKAGTVTLPIERLEVFVTSPDIALIAAFANTGCRVSFCGEDRREGMRIAERTGARFYPYPADEALRLSETPDVIAERNNGHAVSLTFASGKKMAVSADCNVELLAVALCSSQFAGLTKASCTSVQLSAELGR